MRSCMHRIGCRSARFSRLSAPPTSPRCGTAWEWPTRSCPSTYGSCTRPATSTCIRPRVHHECGPASPYPRPGGQHMTDTSPPCRQSSPTTASTSTRAAGASPPGKAHLQPDSAPAHHDQPRRDDAAGIGSPPAAPEEGAGYCPALLQGCSGIAGSERCCDLLDGLGLGGAHVLPFLLVCCRDFAREGEHEAPVIAEFLGRCLGLEQCHRVAEVLQPVIPEFCGRVIPRVIGLGFRRDDLVEKLALAVLGARFKVSLRHRD